MTNSAGPEFVLSGFRGYPTGTSMDGRGVNGFHWSSTAYSSAADAYYLVLYSSGTVNPANNSRKHYGFPLRCLALLHPHHLPTTH